MDKIICFIVSLTFLVFLSMDVSLRADINEQIIFLPDDLKGVKLNMSYLEFKNLLPKSQVIAKEENRTLISYFLKDNKLWDSAGFDFEEDRLESIVLVRGVINKEGVQEAIHSVINRALNNYGRDFKKSVTRSSGILKPLFAWTKEEYTVYLSYTPEEEVLKGRRPTIRFSILIPNRETTGILYILTPSEMEEALFDMIVGKDVKEMLEKGNNSATSNAQED